MLQKTLLCYQQHSSPFFKRTSSAPPASTTEAYRISFHCSSYVVQTQCKAPLPWDTCTHFNAWQFGLAGKTLSSFQKDNSFPHCSFCSHHARSMHPFWINLLASRSTEKAQCQEKDKSTLETGKCLSPFHSEADLPWMGAPRTDVSPKETESQASWPPSIHIKTSSYRKYSFPHPPPQAPPF